MGWRAGRAPVFKQSGYWACPCHTSQVERDDQFHREEFCQAEITKAIVTLILTSTPQRHRPPILFLTKVSTLSYSIVTHPPPWPYTLLRSVLGVLVQMGEGEWWAVEANCSWKLVYVGIDGSFPMEGVLL